MDKRAVKLAPRFSKPTLRVWAVQVAEAQRAGADRIHIDVMDGAEEISHVL